jgi:hypothetical protein
VQILLGVTLQVIADSILNVITFVFHPINVWKGYDKEFCQVLTYILRDILNYPQPTYRGVYLTVEFSLEESMITDTMKAKTLKRNVQQEN